jgi:DNA-binding NarL/FixJ family response regulator
VTDLLFWAGYEIAGQASDLKQALALAERVGGHTDIVIMDDYLARGSNSVETAAILCRRLDIPLSLSARVST